MTITQEVATLTLRFLDRVSIQGHAERNTMNVLFATYQKIANPPPPAKEPETPEETPNGKDETKDSDETGEG